MRRFLIVCLGFIFAVLAALAAVLAFGTADRPGELGSISQPFRTVDFSDLPPLKRLQRDRRRPLAFRLYGETSDQAVILLHGSTGSSASVHPLAQRLRASGFQVYAPDVRGHGESAPRGDVDYLGQVEDDIVALAASIRSARPGLDLSIIGFSASGGLALRIAGGPHGSIADRYILVAPALGRGAPTTRTSGDRWAAPHVPRIIALSILNRAGIDWFNGLEAIAFAVPPDSGQHQTGEYSFRLLLSYLPQDYAANLRAIRRPSVVVAGEKDELFDAGALRDAINVARPDIPVVIVPGVDHIGLTLSQSGITAILDALQKVR